MLFIGGLAYTPLTDSAFETSLILALILGSCRYLFSKRRDLDNPRNPMITHDIPYVIHSRGIWAGVNNLFFFWKGKEQQRAQATTKGASEKAGQRRLTLNPRINYCEKTNIGEKISPDDKLRKKVETAPSTTQDDESSESTPDNIPLAQFSTRKCLPHLK